MKCLLIPAFVIAASVPIYAQEGGDTEITHSALVAGYKASMTCSAVFTAALPLAVIAENELSSIYPDYRERFESLPDAVIDYDQKTVSVTYSRSVPPRIAVWRAGYGCSQLPTGADIAMMGWLPKFNGWPDVSGFDSSTALGSDVILTSNVSYFDRLEIPVSFAFDGNSYGKGTRTSALLIARNGQIVAERYDRGIDAETPQRTWSVGKSITATILGAADEKGFIDLDYPAVLERWAAGGDPRRQITLRNLLQMSSGLDSGHKGSRTDRIYFGGGRVIDQAAGKILEAVPGMRWKYANDDTLLAMRGLREAMKDDAAFHIFPYQDVLWKIGARRTTLEVDWNGDFISSSQVWSTARDLARIGQLYLQDGVWGGERILPEGWVEFVSTPAPAQPRGSDLAYGAQFWLLNNIEGVPEDTFAALGHRGQYLIIVPSRQVIIVRRGYDESGGTRFDIARLTRDVIAAMDAADRAAQAALLAAAAEEGNGE